MLAMKKTEEGRRLGSESTILGSPRGTSEKSLEYGKGAGHADVWGRKDPGRGNSSGKTRRQEYSWQIQRKVRGQYDWDPLR